MICRIRIDRTQYIIVRKDIPIGNAAASIAHAAGFQKHESGTYVVVLEAKSENHLLQIAEKLRIVGVNHLLFAETDPPFNGEAMSIGTELVADRKNIRKCIGRLPLYCGPCAESRKGASGASQLCTPLRE